MWLLAVAAVVADLLVAAIIALGCGIGENQSQEAVDFCDSSIKGLPLGGVVAAVAGGFISRTLQRDWPWVVGVASGLFLAAIVWILKP